MISRGGGTRAAIALANARIKKWCRNMGSRFLDLGQEVLPAGLQKDRLHFNEGAPHNGSQTIVNAIPCFSEQQDLLNPGMLSPSAMKRSKEWLQREKPAPSNSNRGNQAHGDSRAQQTGDEGTQYNASRNPLGTPWPPIGQCSQYLP